MKQLITNLLICCCFCLTIHAQEENKPIKIIWLAPQATAIPLDGDNLPIEVVIEASEKIAKSAIFVLLNDLKLGQKADVVKLGASNKAGTTINFSVSVPLIEGENRLKVGVALGDSTVQYSLTKILIKSGQEVQEITQNYQSDQKGIFWQNPRWQSTSLVIDHPFFKFKVLINSPVAIQKKDIYVVRQQIVKIPLATSAILKELSPGKYELTNTVPLEGKGMMDIAIKIKSPLGGTIVSEPLPINFSPFRPNIHLLAVGPQTNLEYTTADAKDFANLFQNQSRQMGGQLFNTIDIHTITGGEATATAIKSAIERLETKFKNGRIGKKDILLLYLSSHGFLDNRRQLRIQGDDYDPGAWRTTSVSYERDIIEILDGIPCKKLIFIDACHSGGGEKGADVDVKYQIEQLNNTLQGITTMVSSSGGEISYEDDQWKNGAFTEAIIEGLLQYRADRDHNYIITINELWQYIRVRVPALVRTNKNKTQHPQLLSNELGDLAIYYVK